ncbi:hypothetical protein Fot_32729 [Forsythia ovata]|uniref:Uncharacterized protein n=1 Tax=Forsythia ovata TaxID=205694 RepID=A0ABD1T8L9_9LAMI
MAFVAKAHNIFPNKSCPKKMVENMIAARKDRQYNESFKLYSTCLIPRGGHFNQIRIESANGDCSLREFERGLMVRQCLLFKVREDWWDAVEEANAVVQEEDRTRLIFRVRTGDRCLVVTLSNKRSFRCCSRREGPIFKGRTAAVVHV